MGRIFEAAKRLRVKVVSPDGSVKVEYSTASGFAVSFPRSNSMPTDLRRQLEAAMRGALTGHRRAADMILSRARDGRPEPKPSRLRQDMNAIVEELDEQSRSPRGLIAFRWHGADGIAFRVHREPTRTSELDMFAYEANAVIATVCRNRAAHLHNAHKRIFKNESTKR